MAEGTRIGVAARFYFGRSGDWLRKMERSGAIPPAPRDANGYRNYSQEYIETARRILSDRGVRLPELQGVG